MYGLVNRAIEGLVVSQHGESTWDSIKEKAGIDLEAFISMQAYDDDVTYRLVDAASKVLGAPAEKVLESFGEYWISYSAEEGYGELLTMWGDNLVDFLTNMNNLHSRVSLSFPELRPPTIGLSDVENGSFRLHYHSERVGLAPFVVGLVRGLGARFKTEVDIKLESPRGPSQDHDVFEVKHWPATTQ